MAAWVCTWAKGTCPYLVIKSIGNGAAGAGNTPGTAAGAAGAGRGSVYVYQSC
jgi:hypothetical protein